MNTSLCFRCEHRAKFLETKHGPRCECGQIEDAVFSCYMFKPCRPVITVPSDTTDKRPRFGPAMLSSRERAVRLAEDHEVVLNAVPISKTESYLHWTTRKLKRGDVVRTLEDTPWNYAVVLDVIEESKLVEVTPCLTGVKKGARMLPADKVRFELPLPAVWAVNKFAEALVERGFPAPLLLHGVHGSTAAIIGVLCSLKYPTPVFVYHVESLLALFEKDMSPEDAIEWFDFNVDGAYIGLGGPVYASQKFDEDSNTLEFTGDYVLSHSPDWSESNVTAKPSTKVPSGKEKTPRILPIDPAIIEPMAKYLGLLKKGKS